jgi:hypothetical protein
MMSDPPLRSEFVARFGGTARTGAFATLALSGLIGYYVGSRAFPEWQVPVETAQVLAGIVRYPPGNPFLIYHLKLWTILHQICAALLAAGVSEARLSIWLSGATGMLSFQALAMTAYAFTRTIWLSVAISIVVFLSGATNYGIRYPIFLLGTSHTYGSVGLSWIVLVAALLGCGRYRTALLFLGLAPAIHPSLGIWLGVIAALAFASDRQTVTTHILPNWRWFSAGALVTATSLALHLWTGRHVPAIDSSTAAQYLSTFTAVWDEHRQPMGFGNAGAALNVIAVLSGVVWLMWFSKRLPPSAAFVLRFVIASGVVGLACIALSHVPPDRLPGFLVVLMPTRVVNVDVMMFAALGFGILGMYRNVPARVLLIATMAGLVLSHHNLSSLLHPQLRTTEVAFRDRTNDALLATAGRGRGMLLTGGDLHLVQLRTRRPVVLDGGGLDGLPYALAGGPEMARILRDVYDIDFFTPPDEAHGVGVIPSSYNRRIWEAYSQERWQEIRRKYNVSQVMTYNDWTLRLPIVAQNARYLLYEIPE